MFDASASQEELGEYFSPVVDELFAGVNSSVLAYGTTGSGKTHSIYGEKWPTLVCSLLKNKPWLSGNGLGPLAGLALRLAYLVFSKKESEDSKSVVTVKYFQIYNEKIIDLMTVANNLLGQS